MGEIWDFLGGPVVKTLPFNEGGVDLIPGQGAMIPHISWPPKKPPKMHKTEYYNKFNKDFLKSDL